MSDMDLGGGLWLILYTGIVVAFVGLIVATEWAERRFSKRRRKGPRS